MTSGAVDIKDLAQKSLFKYFRDLEHVSFFEYQIVVDNNHNEIFSRLISTYKKTETGRKSVFQRVTKFPSHTFKGCLIGFGPGPV